MKVMVIKNSNLSLDEHVSKIKPYLGNIITDLKNFDTWKIPLKIAINFISLKDVEEECVMHPRSDNIKFASYDDVNKVVDEILEKVVDEIFESLHWRY